jgi:hypothetical protein
MFMTNNKELFRTDPITQVEKFLDEKNQVEKELQMIKTQKNNIKKELELKKKREVLKKNMDTNLKQWTYIDLLAIQSSESLWSRIMTEVDLFMRRRFCRKLNNLSETQIAKILTISDSTAHDLLYKSSQSGEIKMSLMAIIFNTPRLSIADIDPAESKDSYETYIEYYGGAAKRITINEFSREMASVSSISGYIIDNQKHFFDYENKLVFARLIKTYPGLELIEFHLQYEPLLHPEKIIEFIKMFPNAKYILTTFTPLRPTRRCLWIIQNSDPIHDMGLKKFITEIMNHRKKTRFYYP